MHKGAIKFIPKQTYHFTILEINPFKKMIYEKRGIVYFQRKFI